MGCSLRVVPIDSRNAFGHTLRNVAVPPSVWTAGARSSLSASCILDAHGEFERPGEDDWAVPVLWNVLRGLDLDRDPGAHGCHSQLVLFDDPSADVSMSHRKESPYTLSTGLFRCFGGGSRQ